MTRQALERELELYINLASLILPRTSNFPELSHIDYHATVQPAYGCMGGDNLDIVNFENYNLQDKIHLAEERVKQAHEQGHASQEKAYRKIVSMLNKNQDRFGILITDVAGHNIAHSVINNLIYGMFETGVNYELNDFGEVTPRVFELMNTMFYNHIEPNYLIQKPYTTFIYGEISNEGKFRFLSGGHPTPLVFSREFGRLQKLEDSVKQTSTPLGVLPSDFNPYIERFPATKKTKGHYPVNEITLLGKGDVLLLYSDCLTEHEKEKVNFAETRLEDILRRAKDGSAQEIHNHILSEMVFFSPLEDDLTLVVIKKK